MNPFKALNAKIKTKLEGISKLHEVFADPLSEFTGYPAAYITPSDNTNDYETTAENLRIYTFLVRIFYAKDSADNAAALYDAMRDLVDDVLDAFDSDYMLSGVENDLDAKYTMLGLTAAPSAWVYLEQTNMLMAELRISARISVDISN